MKFSNTLYFLLASSGLVSAAPAAHFNALNDTMANSGLEMRSPNKADHALATLEGRAIPATCKKIGRVILTIGTSTAINALINEVAAYAKDICEEQGAPNCVKYVGYIQRGINLIFIAIGFAHGAVGESSSNEQSSFQPGTVRRDLGPGFNNFTQNLGSALQESGFSYDVLDSITVPGLNFGKRDVEPSIVSRLIARNMKANNSSSVYDVAFNYYDNGDLNLHLAGDFETLPWAEEYKSVAQKRFNGAGFKIAVTTRKKSLLTRAHQNEMANHIAADWAVASYREHAGDYFGLVKTDHTANFYFRIIPEVRGFGLGYESVNTCGGMASFL